MCGITGVINLSNLQFGVTEKKLFRDLLIATSLRGKHSTGMFTVPFKNDEPVKILKRAVCAGEFIERDEFTTLMRDFNDYKYVVGHTRYATNGEVNDENAHPFIQENIVLVHNGSVGNKHDICVLGGKTGSDCKVDSESLAVALSKNNIEDFIQKVEGAFTIVWYDTVTHALHFIRNTERPLHFGVVKDEDVILFASEAEALYFVAQRNEVELSKIFSLDVGTLLTFDKNREFKTKKIYDGQVVRPKYRNYYTGYYNNYYDNDYGGCYMHSRPANIPKRVDDLFPDDDDNNPFKSVNMKKYDEIEFIYESFEPYANNNRGCIIGTRSHFPQYEVKVHNFPKDKIVMEIGDECVGRLIGLSENKKYTAHNGQSDKYTLMLDANSIIELIDELYDEYDDIEWDGGAYDAMGQKYLVNGQYVDYEVFRKATEDGCEVCSCPINSIDDYTVAWTDLGRPICQDCAKTGDYNSHIAVKGV